MSTMSELDLEIPLEGLPLAAYSDEVRVEKVAAWLIREEQQPLATLLVKYKTLARGLARAEARRFSRRFSGFL